MVLGFISIMTASLIETVYIGRVGTAELAAISFTFPLVMVMQAISMGLSVGASSVVARIMGVGDREKARSGPGIHHRRPKQRAPPGVARR
jgi:Na+-driven multidrug efflux pump